ncbi:MAG: recombinase family protein [Defluviitaleaceae bacterium]|nr:recombinase family protein [Defluviitaleaceae bacterium]
MARVSRKKINEKKQLEMQIFRAALYVRLSVEDVRKQAAGSAGGQRDFLLKFLQERYDLEFYGLYEDINYTGTNFERPEFKRMMEDVQAGSVNCVVVKDLSRFGRNFLESGQYLEEIFPSLQVRFISVMDNYDSHAISSSGIVPVKNLMNEAVARDISKKVRAAKELKRARGEFLGPFAPYGYLKVGSGLVVDKEAARVVSQIFKWVLEGFGDRAIVGKLNEMGVLPPSRYRFERGIVKAKAYGDAKIWHKSAVRRVLENSVHIGGVHDAIVDEDVFEAVRNLRDSPQSPSPRA